MYIKTRYTKVLLSERMLIGPNFESFWASIHNVNILWRRATFKWHDFSFVRQWFFNKSVFEICNVMRDVVMQIFRLQIIRKNTLFRRVYCTYPTWCLWNSLVHHFHGRFLFRYITALLLDVPCYVGFYLREESIMKVYSNERWSKRVITHA